MNTSTILTRLAVLLLTIAPATAQLEDTTAGPGRQTMAPLALDRITGRAACNGITWLNGLAYVSARGDRASAFNPNSVFVIDIVAGQLVREGSQRTSPPGPTSFLDGDNDGSSLLFGSSQGIWVCDPASIAPGREIGLSNVVVAANGPQTLSANPIAGPALMMAGAYAGVAYDPHGNGGNGSLWTGNVLSPLFEIDLDGNVLRSIPNPGLWIRGLALDPQAGTLWVNATRLSFTHFLEIDVTTGRLTGRQILRDRIGGVDPGGLDLVPGGLDGRGCGNDLLELDRRSTDQIVAYRLNLWDRFASTREPVLTVGVDGGRRFTGTVSVPRTASTVEWHVSNPAAYALIINFPPRSRTLRPVGPLAPGFRSLWELRRDLGAATVIAGSGDTVISLPIPALLASGRITLQAIQLQPGVIDPGCGLRYGLATSNESAFEFTP